MFDIFYINNRPDIKFAKKVESIDEASRLSRTRYLWIVDGNNDYSDFDFTQEPVTWENRQTHIWASQHQENGGTYLIPKYHSNEVNYKDECVVRNKVASPIVFLDFGNNDSIKSFDAVRDISNTVLKTRFISSYHGTLSRIVDKVDSEYVWITSSVCDYSDFDFTWHPSEWHKTMFHVFPSNDQRFGDTFYIHTPTFKEQVNNIELLEWYETIHFVKDISVPRWSIPYVETYGNSIVGDIKMHNFTEPVVLFTNDTSMEYNIPTINLWREKTRTIIPLSKGGNTTVVPRDAKNHIVNQAYDYPHINKSHMTYSDPPLDIVYISNGEENADSNWEHLQNITKDVPNRLVRVDKVNGRAEAYKEAAKQSNTAWFFAVFAKLEVNPEFDWSWQTDKLQEDKHYIFHARNSIVGVEYGHAAIIAYHKNLVLENPSRGLDFTLDQPHEVVPILSGTTFYDNDIHTAWRTSFREAIKLHEDVIKTNNIESDYRLSKWCSSNGTEVGEWNMKGGLDGVEYYNEVNGDFDALRLTYEWEWLNDRFKQKYGQV